MNHLTQAKWFILFFHKSLVFIDDATSETLHLKFVKSENTFDDFEATREYITKHGKSEAFYPI